MKLSPRSASMFKKSHFLGFCIISLLWAFAIDNVCADLDTASQYIESRQHNDGSWGTDPATIYFETTEAVKTLYFLGRTGDAYQRGVNFIANFEIDGVEDHARTIESIFPSGIDVSDDINNIIASQNTDGGFGFDTDYASDVYHTALALIALKAASIFDSGIISPAISYMISQQNIDGSYGLSANHDSIYLTSMATLALFKFSSTYDLNPQLNDANNWLIIKQNADGGFGFQSYDPLSFVNAKAWKAASVGRPSKNGVDDGT